MAKKWRTYRGQSHYGDYAEFQQFKSRMDWEAEWDRKYKKKYWTLPDKTTFYGTHDEFISAKQRIYDKWNQEKAERESKRRETEQSVVQADELIRSQLQPLVTEIPRGSNYRREVQHQLDRYYDVRRDTYSKDSGDIVSIAMACIAIGVQAFEAWKSAEEKRRKN